jgi:hypothetical protein
VKGYKIYSSALKAFEQGGIFIVPHLLWHGTSVYSVSSEERPPMPIDLIHGIVLSISKRGSWGKAE